MLGDIALKLLSVLTNSTTDGCDRSYSTVLSNPGSFLFGLIGSWYLAFNFGPSSIPSQPLLITVLHSDQFFEHLQTRKNLQSLSFHISHISHFLAYCPSAPVLLMQTTGFYSFVWLTSTLRAPHSLRPPLSRAEGRLLIFLTVNNATVNRAVWCLLGVPMPFPWSAQPGVAQLGHGWARLSSLRSLPLALSPGILPACLPPPATHTSLPSTRIGTLYPGEGAVLLRRVLLPFH